MSISIVNGYVCTSCSDVAKAKKGENPADSKDGAVPTKDARSKDATRANDPAAVVFGGSLAALPGVASSVQPDTGSVVDRRA